LPIAQRRNIDLTEALCAQYKVSTVAEEKKSIKAVSADMDVLTACRDGWSQLQ
jgi:hypothetical protein